MKKDIMDKIELLVEMSGTVNTYETLCEELTSINLDIEKQKGIVRDFKKAMSDNKYLKANERIIDENIKIGIENRLTVSNADLKDLEIQIANVSCEEEVVHASIISFEKELNQLKRFMDSLELKMKTIGEKDPNVYSFYDSLISKTNDDIKRVENALENRKNEYNKITLKLEKLGTNRSTLEDKIEKEKINLTEVLNTLANPNSYIDYKAKKQDEELIDSYNAELEALEHKRLEILTDPAYIGQEAKELYMDEDKTSSLNKIRELVTIIQSKPFMETNSIDLDELLEDAINRRDEFANAIENKSYDGEDVSVIEMRTKYLEDLKEKTKVEMDELRRNISDIDLVFVKDLSLKIESIKDVRNRLNEDIEIYRSVIQENADAKTPKKKASLKSALKKETDELNNVESILSSFEKDLEDAVIQSKDLEEHALIELENKIISYEKEIAEIRKQNIMNSRSKDILAVERDKDELKKLSDEVQNIMNRKKYSRTASEIFDEIEMFYGTEHIEVENEESATNDFVDLNDYRIEVSEDGEPVMEDSTIEPEIKTEDIVEESPIEDSTIFESVPVMDEFEDIFSSINLDEVTDFPPRSSIEEETNLNRLKVINVEPIEEEKDVNNKEVLEDDILFSDFLDTDYISFNDLLEGDSNEN